MDVETMLKEGGLSARRAKTHAEGVGESLKRHLASDAKTDTEKKKPKSKKVTESKDVIEPKNDYEK